MNKINLSLFWRLEIQDQGAQWIDSLVRPPSRFTEILSVSSPGASGRELSGVSDPIPEGSTLLT